MNKVSRSTPPKCAATATTAKTQENDIKEKKAQANRRNRTQSRAKRTTNKCGHFATVRPPYMAWDPLAHGLRADFCLLDYAKLKG